MKVFGKHILEAEGEKNIIIFWSRPVFLNAALSLHMGPVGEKQDQSNTFSVFCVYHALKLQLGPHVVMETAAAGEGKKRLDCCWT